MAIENVLHHLKESLNEYMRVAKTQEQLDEYACALQQFQRHVIAAAAGDLSPITPQDMPSNRVFICFPNNGPVELEAAMAAMQRGIPMGKPLGATFNPQSGSALAHNFNKGWCEWLNRYRSGNPHDYFYLNHADIAPAPGMIWTLREELEKHGYDVIHGVAAIKDNTNYCSTAVGNPYDEWEGVRKLTGTELEQLPDVFDLDDVLNTLDGPWHENAALLCNTGCLLVKYGPWCREFALDVVDNCSGFTIKDRIFEGPHGQLYAHYAPEDWGFGRWCARHGIKVAGTKKVKVGHVGRAIYVNPPDGGLKTDTHFLSLAAEGGVKLRQPKAEAEKQNGQDKRDPKYWHPVAAEQP